MAYTLADRVQETTDAAGTGNVTLQGAVAGYRTFASALTNGAVVPYVITDGTAWETGSGTYNAGVLTRGTVKASSNANAAITVTAGMKIFIDAISDVFTPFIDWGNPISITGSATLTVGKHHVITITSADSAVMLPSAAANTNKLISIELAGSTNKLIHLTTGAASVTKTGTVSTGTALGDQGTGTVSTSGSSVTLTGSGTLFTTEIRVGDLINTTNGQRRVTAIASNTSLTMDSVATISSSKIFIIQNGIVGTGTTFSTEYIVGDGITVNGETRKIVWISGANNLAVDRPFAVASAGVAHGKTTEKIDGEYVRTMWANTLDNVGETALLLSDGTHWHKLSGVSLAMTGTIYLNTTQSLSNAVWALILHNSTAYDPSGIIGLYDGTSYSFVKPYRKSKYVICAGVFYDGATGTGVSQLTIKKNGVDLYNSQQWQGAAVGLTYFENPPTLPLLPGDMITSWAWSNCSGTIRLNPYGTQSICLGLTEVPSW